MTSQAWLKTLAYTAGGAFLSAVSVELIDKRDFNFRSGSAVSHLVEMGAIGAITALAGLFSLPPHHNAQVDEPKKPPQ